jgi:hypothetical protein
MQRVHAFAVLMCAFSRESRAQRIGFGVARKRLTLPEQLL